MPFFRVKLERTVVAREVCEVFVEAKDVSSADKIIRADAKANRLDEAPWRKDLSSSSAVVITDVDEMPSDYLHAAE